MDNRYYAFQRTQYHQQSIYEYGYPCDERTRMDTNAIASSSGNSSYLPPPLETTTHGFNDYGSNYMGNANAGGDDIKLKRTRMNTNAIASSSGNSSYLPPPLETRTHGFNDYGSNYMGNANAGDDGIKLKIQGKPVDPRVVTLLEMYRELFLEKEEIFKRIFPGLHQDFVDLINQVGELPSPGKMERFKVQTLQRSLSVGSPHTPSRRGLDSPMRMERFKVRTLNLGGGPDSPLKLERFKVRTLNLGGVQQEGGQRPAR